MAIEHVKPADGPDNVAELLKRDGCCIVDRLVEPEVLDRATQELAPWLTSVGQGPDDFSGRQTRRIGGLIGRSETVRDLIQDDLVLGAVKASLSHARSFQIHLTQVIAIDPGQPAQPIHRDQWAFDFFPFPKGYEAQTNTIWAMTDFTEENGATRAIPGSHLYDDKLTFEHSDTEPAEMEKGSVFFYTGALYHGGGANNSDATRIGLNLTYNLSWLRQEENQYLSVPHDIARELPEKLLRLMGYARGAYALGYIDDLRDPIEALRPTQSNDGFGDVPLNRE